MAVFMLFRTRNRAAKVFCHKLHTVANPQNRYACLEYAFIQLRGIFHIYTGRAAGKDNAFRVVGKDFFRRLIIRQNFTIYAAFAYSSGNQLRILPAKVDDDNSLLVFHSIPPVGIDSKSMWQIPNYSPYYTTKSALLYSISCKNSGCPRHQKSRHTHFVYTAFVFIRPPGEAVPQEIRYRHASLHRLRQEWQPGSRLGRPLFPPVLSRLS